MSGVRTHVFSERDGSQHLLCVFPDGRMTLAHRRDAGETWSAPCNEDTYYRDLDPRPVHEIAALVGSVFGEAL